MHSTYPHAMASSMFPEMNAADVVNAHRGATMRFRRYGFAALAGLAGLLISMTAMVGSSASDALSSTHALGVLTVTFLVFAIVSGLGAFANLLRAGVLEVDMDRRAIRRD